MGCGRSCLGLGLTALRVVAFVTIVSFTRVTAVRANTVASQAVADAQCLLVGARFAGSADQRQRLSGEMLLSYFLGRMDGRYPRIDLMTLLRREASKMTSADFTKAARRCGAEFSARGTEMARIGQSLGQLGN